MQVWRGIKDTTCSLIIGLHWFEFRLKYYIECCVWWYFYIFTKIMLLFNRFFFVSCNLCSAKNEQKGHLSTVFVVSCTLCCARMNGKAWDLEWNLQPILHCDFPYFPQKILTSDISPDFFLFVYIFQFILISVQKNHLDTFCQLYSVL